MKDRFLIVGTHDHVILFQGVTGQPLALHYIDLNSMCVCELITAIWSRIG
jgi:hypothetical protein